MTRQGSSISLQRQAYLALGITVIIGLFMAFVASSWWLVFPGIAGVLLLTGAISGRCKIINLISKLPWNSYHSGDIENETSLRKEKRRVVIHGRF
ncbi:MAG: hypothetical protein V1736_10160 [Pseudomonadota bacterium]